LYVYMLKCQDGSYYTGITNDPERRLQEHQEGDDPKTYTHSRRPVTLVYCDGFSDYMQAIEWEKRIKGWSRKKKEALIASNFSLLHELAECRNESHFKNRESCFDSAQHDKKDSTQHDRIDCASHDTNTAPNNTNNSALQSTLSRVMHTNSLNESSSSLFIQHRNTLH